MKKSMILLLTLLLIICLGSTIEAKTKFDESKVYQIELSLKTISLEPPAIVFAIFDQDPLVTFKNNLIKSREWYEDNIKDCEKGKHKYFINALVSGAWDRTFKTISGDKVYLLLGKQWTNTVSSDISKGIEKTIYFASKSTYTKSGDLIFWYLPVKVKAGAKLKLVLNDKNSFNYKDLKEAKYIDFSLLKK